MEREVYVLSEVKGRQDRSTLGGTILCEIVKCISKLPTMRNL